MTYPLSAYKLTLPVNAQGALTGSAAEVKMPELAAYHSQFFDQAAGVYTFTCPDGGATTDTATHARTELRNLTEWTYKDHASDIPLTLSVDKIAPGYAVLVLQIHDKKEPWAHLDFKADAKGTATLKLSYRQRDGDDPVSVLLLDNLLLGQRINVTQWEYQPPKWFGIINGKLIVVANGVRKAVTMKRKGKGGSAYFKRGCYYQNANRKGDVCVITHY